MNYHIHSKDKQIIIRHSSILPLFSSVVILAANLFGVYHSIFQLQSDSRYVLLGFSLCGSCLAIIFLIKFPFLTHIVFDHAAKQLSVSKTYVFGARKKTYPCCTLRDIVIKETDHDGYWYTPVLKLGHEEIKLGFGFGVCEAVEATITCIQDMESAITP